MIEPPNFLIVGTPRSGTTLVQRLACELPGVRVPPETHFFSLFALDLAARRRFPIKGPDLRAELVAYSSMRETEDLGLRIDDAMGLLDGRCSSVGQFFSALVRTLVGPVIPVCGEKTPDHLLWWRPVTRAFPELRIVAVVRDPRAVVASSLEVPFGMRHPLLLAQRWAADQRQLAVAEKLLGPRRILVLRYEDVVADPAGVRGRLSAFLGTNSAVSPEVTVPEAPGPIFVEREVWKRRVTQDVTPDRVEVWRQALRPATAVRVAAICRREMRDWGYIRSESDVRGPWSISGAPQATMELKRLYFRAARLQQMHRVNRTAV